MKTTSTHHSDTVSLVRLKLMISVKYDHLAHTHWVETKLSEVAEWTMLCDWVETRSVSMMGTSEQLMAQIQS